MTVPDAAKANDRFSSYATSGLPSIRVLNRNACVAAAQAACCNTHGCTRCTTRADTSFHPLFHAPLRSASGGARSLKPMVGRGPRDQSSGQKPRARLPEVLACPAALRFKRANGREAGRAGLQRLLLNYGLNPFLGGVLDECGRAQRLESRCHFILKNDPMSLFGFCLPRLGTQSSLTVS